MLFNFRSQNELLEVVVECITEEKREISISDIISNQLNALFSKVFKEKLSFEVFFYRQVNKELRRYLYNVNGNWGSWNYGEKMFKLRKEILYNFSSSIVIKGVKNSADKKFTRRNTTEAIICLKKREIPVHHGLRTTLE